MDPVIDKVLNYLDQLDRSDGLSIPSQLGPNQEKGFNQSNLIG